MADAKQEIRDLLENWARAVREQDLESVLAHHADDVVMYDVPMPLQSRGLDEYRKTWELFFDHNDGGPGAFDIMDMDITAGDTVAFAHGLVNIFGSTVRITVGLRRRDGEWQIVHEHHSYPIELE